MHSDSGFSLIEMLISVVLFGLIAIFLTSILTLQIHVRNSAHRVGERNSVFSKVGKEVGDVPVLFETFKQSKLNSQNPCFLACLDNAFTPTPGACTGYFFDDSKEQWDIVPQAAADHCISRIGGKLVWYKLALYEPSRHIPISGPNPSDAGKPDPNDRNLIRYSPEGAICSLANSATCPIQIDTRFHPMCSDGNGDPLDDCGSPIGGPNSRAAAYSILVQEKVSSDLRAGNLGDMASLKNLGSKAETKCEEIFPKNKCALAAVPIILPSPSGSATPSPTPTVTPTPTPTPSATAGP